MRKRKWSWFFKEANEENQLLLINFKKHLQMRDLKESSIFDYQKEIYRLMLYFQKKNIKTLEVTTDDIKEYLDTMDVSEARMTRLISVLNRFYRHNYKKGYIKENPIENIKK